MSFTLTLYNAQFQSVSKGRDVRRSLVKDIVYASEGKNLKGIIRKSSHKIVDETHGLFTSVK